MTNKPETFIQKKLIKRKDGLYYRENAKVPFTGLRKEFVYGQLKSKENYKNGEKHGTWEWFDWDEQLESKENYQNGERHGPSEFFGYDNGQLMVKQNYKKDRLHGPTEWFYENGQLEFRENYKDGKSNGLREYFDENGKLIE